MAQLRLKNKVVTIDDALYSFMKERYFELDEDDCKDLIRPVLTTGDFIKGFSFPDMDDVLSQYSAEKLSALLTEGILLRKEFMR